MDTSSVPGLELIQIADAVAREKSSEDGIHIIFFFIVTPCLSSLPLAF